MVLPFSPEQPHDGNKGGRQVKAYAMKRAMAMETRVASSDKDNDNGNKGGKQATLTMAMVAAMTVVGEDEGNGNGNEGGRQRRG
jgi:hypothetical protein